MSSYPSRFPTARPSAQFLCRAGLLAVLLNSHPLSAQSPLEVDKIHFLGATDLSIDFSGTGLLEEFAVEALLPDGSWQLVPTASVESLGGSAWRATVPYNAALPTALYRVTQNGEPITGTFSSPSSTVLEGENGGALVQFSGLFNGTLLYTVDPGGQAGPQSGSIQVNGADSVLIPISVPDDAESGTLRSITINLEGGDLLLGNLTTTHITVEDNDSEWAGVLISDSDGASTQVGLKVAVVNGVTTAILAGDEGGIFPATPGGWPATWSGDAQGLSASAMDMIVPASDTIYAAETKLSLTLNASGAGAVKFSDGVISGYEGTFTLNSTVESLPYLTIPQRTGTFALFRKPELVPPAVEVQPIGNQ